MTTSVSTRTRPARTSRDSENPIADAELREQIAAHLRERGLESLEVAVSGGNVTVAGRVSSEYERQMAAQTLRRISGIEQLTNLIRVAPAAQARSSTASRAADVGSGLLQQFAGWFAETPKIAWVVIGLAFLVPTTMFSCGGPTDVKVPVHPVAGKVSFNGEVPAGAVVTLNPQGQHDPKSAAPKGIVKPDGSFNVSVYSEGDGAPPGDYVVTLQWFKVVSNAGGSGAGPNVLPRAYASPETSPVKITVKEGANELPPIEIKSTK